MRNLFIEEVQDDSDLDLDNYMLDFVPSNDDCRDSEDRVSFLRFLPAYQTKEERVNQNAHERTQMLVVRCALAMQEDDDWRRIAIFHMYLKCNGRSCKLIIDSDNCTNVVSSNTVARLGLKTEPHLNPYRVSWVDSTSIPMSQRCLVPLELSSYKDQLWCDVVSMDVGHIILGRPWLYNLDVTNFGRSNVCIFEFEGRKVRLHPLPPMDSNIKKSNPKEKSLQKEPRVKERDVKGKDPKSKGIHVLGALEFERDLQENLKNAK